MNNYANMLREICRITLCDDCLMYRACQKYNGRFSHYPSDVVEEIIKAIYDRGKYKELKILEKYDLTNINME